MSTVKELKNILSRAFSHFYIYEATREEIAMPATATVYQMNYTFDDSGMYWLARFDDSFDNGILYRPDIVNEMEAKLPRADRSQGLLICGSPGVGKSHSLYNLVQKLRSEGHIVTFIPDCARFSNIADFWKALCRSLLLF